jgi:hypothetical protein
MQCSEHESLQFSPLLPSLFSNVVAGSASDKSQINIIFEPHAGKLARVVLAGDPGILY